MTPMKKNSTLFEVSWEVCNKVGGIYTVITSKMLQTMQHAGGQYYAIGPDLGPHPEFEETDEAHWKEVRAILAARNLQCRLGRWNIPGRPRTILVRAGDRYHRDQLLYELWSRYGVDSLSGGWDYVEPVMFSTACGEVIAAISQNLIEPQGGKAVAQFHEWLTGAGLLTVKRLAPHVGTVFTTHATVLGRAMAGAGQDIYRRMRQINPSMEAGAYGVTAKCSMETVTAREADCFTTVSDITADETDALLGRRADVVTPNGLDLQIVPDMSRQRQRPQSVRRSILDAAGRLLRRSLAEDTQIFMISGRYEFRNKGIDIFLEALAGLNDDLHQSKRRVLALCAVMGGHSGINADAVSGDEKVLPAGGGHWLSPHHVHAPAHDPILQACYDLGLDNRPENPVQVIFIPALLDGSDGFLNLPYNDVLSACDLGVFPSWYEPWGYTPQESIAHAVPTVTTDLAGFGLWAREAMKKGQPSGVEVIARRGAADEEVVLSLRKCFCRFSALDDAKLTQLRIEARQLSQLCTWEQFFSQYLEAFDMALSHAQSREALERGAAVDEEKIHKVFDGLSSLTPVMRSFTAVARLPEAIGRLRELAHNLWWSWHPESWELFSALHSASWERGAHNPIVTLERASLARMKELVNTPSYMERYRAVMADFDAYMSAPSQDCGDLICEKHPVAYFSTEYGLTECLPIYSGGLGILSGDHLKAASDLKIPLVGIGLLYRSGYFTQKLDKEGRQVPHYSVNDFSSLPVELVMVSDDEPLEIHLDLPGRNLYAQMWLVRVGRVKLYLLDTDIPRNMADDRRVSDQLYVADRDVRIRQEILLGMGGMKLCETLGLKPALYHMNEGHSAFLILERLRSLITGRGMSFDAACELVKGTTIFTTHTPVEAGNERFSLDLMKRYFSDYCQSLGLAWSELERLGTFDGEKRDSFEMTVLALNYAFRANGVSRLHGQVSRYMWQEHWKGVPVAEVPISHVTNGVHTESSLSTDMNSLMEQYLGPRWFDHPADSQVWSQIDSVPDEELWQVRTTQKFRLLNALASSVSDLCRKLNVSRQDQRLMMAGINPSALVIGFARRFAPYKRATLVLADLERLKAIVSNSNRPVIFIFAGKAHPADGIGIDLIQKVIQVSKSPEFLGKIFFIENYNLAISRLLVQGCDVWLNTPRRPYEASGTSGQKVAPNGGLNLSISDGWWYEGDNGENGWTIGPRETFDALGREQSDYADAESLYTLLEDSVVPLFFERGGDNIPHHWLRRVKRSIATLTPRYSCRRMVGDYLEQLYIPTAARGRALWVNGRALPARLALWKSDVASRFSTLKVEQCEVEGLSGDVMGIDGQSFITVKVALDCGAMEAHELLAQLVSGPSRGHLFDGRPDVVPLKLVESSEDKAIFKGQYQPRRSGQYLYGVRIMPFTEDLDSPLDSGLVLWA